MQKDVSKMFMASVLWSDQSEIIVYRSFQEFKKLHKQLKNKFPRQNPFRTSERVIPRFRVRNMKTYHKKDSSKSLRHLAFLERYCTELLKCDPSITQSSEVIQFFLPQNQDLQPEFPKNSIMILPLEDIADSKGRGVDATGGKRISIGNVTQPFVTETYRCVAPYETKDTKNRPFKVAVDEMVDVLIKDKAGWWLVENDGKCLAWFPAPYLVKCDNDDEEDDHDGRPVEGMLYCAVRNYTSKKEDEVSVHIGSVVEVLQKSDDGWWLIRIQGKAGYVPSMYLKPYSNPLVQFQREMHTSTLNLAQLHYSENSMLSDHTHGSRVPSPLRPMGVLLSASDKINSRSLDMLLDRRCNTTPPALSAVRGSRKGSLGGASEGSEFSFSDDCSSTGSNRSDREERQYGSATPSGKKVKNHSPDSSLSEGKLSSSSSDLNLLKNPSAPKVPARPRDEEILSRCTTFTRKAALASKARLLPELKQMQGR
ncbi:hypothetical protein AAFF_G00081800 [Aldrovandia affinis]|uniref:NADPH oxidase organizer 1 n=1 Tax=Aldrovandia affinis TaxID=143900 RepID=A0AAD7T4A8_9TELE|nr:hypothetical protein AAFF_G00081800 [Aldrovandia affinis]